MRGHDRTRLAPPKTELSFTLAACVTEIDLSMLDRLTAVFNADPFAVEERNGQDVGEPPKNTATATEKPAPKFELKVECCSVDASLRWDMVFVVLKFFINFLFDECLFEILIED